MKTWEYATVEQMVTDEDWAQQDERIYGELNWMGRDGWELVSTVPRLNLAGKTTSLIFVFKREAQDGEE